MSPVPKRARPGSRRRRLAGLAVATVVAIGSSIAVAAPAAAEGTILGAGHPDAIPGSYIVVLDDTGPGLHRQALAGQLASRYGVAVAHTYRHALHGFAGRMSEATARRLAAEPGVAYVEQNATVTTTGSQQPVPSWGLNRVDQRNLPLDNTYSFRATAGGVRAYVIDTGIRVSHTTFGGRAVWGTNTTGDGINTDCNGHGTHVAGTIGGSQYGVAKSVRLTAVKVLGCTGSGSFAGVAAGVDWVTGNHPAGAPAVANMSLGAAGSNATVENAVRSSIADGVVYTISSGNSNSNACNFTPARVAEAITVNASTQTDVRASFSNFGSCTDIFAPGVAIVSAWNSSDTATNTLQGTSMAAPHVAGGAALVLALHPGFSPAQVATLLLNQNASFNRISNPGAGSPNRLLFTLEGVHGLTRWNWPGQDHLSSTGYPGMGSVSPGPGYHPEGTLGMVHTSQVSGTQPIYTCRVGLGHLFNDTFTSRDQNCEGRIFMGLAGYVYASPPAAAHFALHRCLDPRGQHFDSLSASCEGQTTEGVLGYTLQ